MTDCIFCKIINHDAPSNIVYEDDKVIAIVPLDQVSKGHTLVIPKHHSKNILDTDDKTLSYILPIIKSLSIKLIKENNAAGVNIVNANGKDAQQTVFHLHFHIIPRYKDDGLDMLIKLKSN